MYLYLHADVPYISTILAVFGDWSLIPVSRQQLNGSSTMADVYENRICSAYCLVVKTRTFGRTDCDDDHFTFGTLSKQLPVGLVVNIFF